MEPVAISVFFVAPTAEVLFGNYRWISADNNGTIYDNDRDRQITAYEVISNLAEAPQDRLRRAVESKGSFDGRYLQLPPLDPRVPALAEQVTASERTPYDKARALERYLSTNFGYTLQLPSPVPDDPIAYFLFTRKQGHCEYFASAMAVMLRSLGIPARIVNGFRTGEYNDVTGSYIIRARDAHSWVEAYFPGAGWASFDPTPAAVRPVTTSMWNRMLLYIDAAREFWREWVINYDFSHQRTLTNNAASRTRRLIDEWRRWLRRQYNQAIERAERIRDQAKREPAKWTGRTILGLTILLFLVIARPLWRAWSRRRLMHEPGRAPATAAGLWYARMTRALAHRGWRKRPTQSPREFVRAIDDPTMRRRVESFTETYERARFGASSAEAEKLPEKFRELVQK
jgi:transglutaminase-like putative cysteine protease